MLFFRTKVKLIDTKLFTGAVDWHSHILPGVDDGIRTMQEALAVLAYYEKIGISEVWLTPHIMEDMPNTLDDLTARYQELQVTYKGSVQLHLSAENMLDNLFNERLAKRELLPIGSQRDHLLVETSYYQPPIDLYGTLKRIKEIGYQPILAHPERYRYMEDTDYDYLASLDVKFQLNITSLAGAYGKPAQEKAQMLLSKGYYHFFGSDLHNLDGFKEAIHTKALKKEVLPFLPGIPNHTL